MPAGPVLQSSAMRISVLGAGYVGLVTGACLAGLRHSIQILEVDPRRLEPLREGTVPFHEPGIQQLVSEGMAQGSLMAAGNAAEALHDADLAMICVGTPLHADGDADLSQIMNACSMLADTAPDMPVVVRSTLPLGTTPFVFEWLRHTGRNTVVTNPEFLRQGSAISDFMAPTRIVIGTESGAPTPLSDRVAGLYRELDAPLLVTDFNSAEMVKNAANAFLATKLSFVNEVADLCEAYGADVEDVIRGMGLDPRIGGTYLRPGIGFGGSCLPKELANLVRLGRREGLTMSLMSGAAQTNEDRGSRVADRLEGAVGPLRGRRVAVLGLSFKPHTDDTRYSPAMALIDVLAERGADVVAHDPVVTAPSREGFSQADTAEAAMRGACIVVLATEWPEYRDLDWALLAEVADEPTMYDGRGALDHGLLARSGWTVISVGRPLDRDRARRETVAR